MTLTKKGEQKISTVKNRCHKLWREIIYKSANYMCEVCGKTEHLNPHHIITRGYNIYRFDPLNGVCLCSGCHTFKNQSAHKDPQWFMHWLQQNCKKRYAHTHPSNRKKPVPLKLKDYLEIEKELKEML